MVIFHFGRDFVNMVNLYMSSSMNMPHFSGADPGFPVKGVPTNINTNQPLYGGIRFYQMS